MYISICSLINWTQCFILVLLYCRMIHIYIKFIIVLSTLLVAILLVLMVIIVQQVIIKFIKEFGCTKISDIKFDGEHASKKK